MELRTQARVELLHACITPQGCSGSNLFDPENPDYSIDLSDNELNNELEDDHECQEDDLNVEFQSVCMYLLQRNCCLDVFDTMIFFRTVVVP